MDESECTCFWRPSLSCPIHGALARCRSREAHEKGRSRKIVESFDPDHREY
jgi:hypothetical protein